jgi:hypothetical protein
MANVWTCQRTAPASAAALSDDIGTALVAMGWTLYDTVAATDRVYSSNGAAGDRITEYIRVKVNASTVEFYAYLFWNAGTNTGYGTAYSNSMAVTWAAGQKWIISGDMDWVTIWRATGTSNTLDFMQFGHIPVRVWDTPLATLANAEVAGAGVTIELDNTTDFVVNRGYQIIDGTTGCRERILVTAINPGVSITATLANNYAAGSKVGATPSTFGLAGFSTNGRHANLCPTCPYDIAGTGAGTSTTPYSWITNNPLRAGDSDPDSRTGYYSGSATGLYILSPLYFSGADNGQIGWVWDKHH